MAKTASDKVRKLLKDIRDAMDEVVELNYQLEDLLEESGIEYGFDFVSGYMLERGYEIPDISGFVRAFEKATKEDE